MSQLSDNIKARRLELGMTQEQLGKEAGNRNVTQINAYERGRSRPSPRVLAEIAEALETKPDHLLGLDNDKATEQSVSTLVDQLRHAVATSLSCNPNAVRIIVDLA